MKNRYVLSPAYALRPALCCAAVALLFACGQASNSAGTSSGVPKMAAEAAPTDTENPCKLFTLSELERVFPGIAAGEHSDSDDKYGVATCQWRNSDDVLTFTAQRWKYEGGTVLDDLRDVAQAAFDSYVPNLDAKVRFETLPGIGDEAFVVVEPSDPAKGIQRATAALNLRKGGAIVSLWSPELALRDRNAAIASLRELGLAAAARM